MAEPEILRTLQCGHLAHNAHHLVQAAVVLVPTLERAILQLRFVAVTLHLVHDIVEVLLLRLIVRIATHLGGAQLVAQLTAGHIGGAQTKLIVANVAPLPLD